MIFTSPQEAKLFVFIQWFILTHEVAPTLVEMAVALDLSKSTVNIYLQRLIKKGYVARQYGVERGLTLVNQE